MLDSISIGNIKPVEQLDVDASQINLLVGRNNTGKTTILDSIAWACEPRLLEHERDYPIQEIIHKGHDTAQITLSGRPERDLSVKRPSAEDIIARIHDNLDREDEFIDFLDVDDPDTFRETVKQNVSALPPEMLEVVGTNMLYLAENGEILINKQANALRAEHYEELFHELTRSTPVTEDHKLPQLVLVEELLFGTRFGQQHDASVDGPVYVKDFRRRQRAITDSKDSKRALRRVEEALQETIQPGLDRIYVDQSGVTEVGFDSGEIIDFGLLGDGLKSLIVLLHQVYTNSERHDIILLDEPGTHMHAGYVHEFVRLLAVYAREADAQFFISTHNRDIIEAFLDTDDELSGFLADAFTLTRLEHFNDSIIASQEAYESAETSYHDVLLDLRGI